MNEAYQLKTRSAHLASFYPGLAGTFLLENGILSRLKQLHLKFFSSAQPRRHKLDLSQEHEFCSSFWSAPRYECIICNFVLPSLYYLTKHPKSQHHSLVKSYLINSFDSILNLFNYLFSCISSFSISQIFKFVVCCHFTSQDDLSFSFYILFIVYFKDIEAETPSSL